MSNIKSLRSKIIEQIENVIYEEEKADDVKICIKKDKVKVTLNNNKPFYISYKNYSKKKILNDNDSWIKLVKKSIKKELKKSSHKEIYAVYLVDGFDLGDIDNISYVQIKSIHFEIRTFFCYATKNKIGKFMNSNQGKLKHEINDIIEIPDYVLDQIEDINGRDGDIAENDGDRSISRSRSLDPYHHIQRIGALGKTENINYPSDLFVFVLDSGLYNHKDLNINTDLSRDYTSSSIKWDDSNGHGTHVSGIIGAKDSRFAVAPGVKIIMHKVLGDDGRGDTQSILKSLNEINLLKTWKPSAKIVVNISFGSKITREEAISNNYKSGNVTGPPPILRLHELLIIKLIKRGITFIIGAGNDSSDTSVFIPARIPEAITVGAYSSDKTVISSESDAGFPFNTMANFSNFGSLIDIMAPGVNIYSTWRGDSYNTISGTSMATPIVTGAVVNMIAVEAIKNPNKILTPQEIKDRLRFDAENSYAANINEKIKLTMYNFDYSLCWRYPSEFTLNDCLNWWILPTYENRKLIAQSSVNQTYPYSVYIGKYFNKDALISNY